MLSEEFEGKFSISKTQRLLSPQLSPLRTGKSSISGPYFSKQGYMEKYDLIFLKEEKF